MFLTTRMIALPAAALLAAAALAGCGGSSPAGSSPSSGSGSGTTGKGLVAFIPGATGVGFYDALEEGAKAEAAKLGYTFLYQGSPDFTPAAQTPVVNAVCTKHPKILLIAPTDPVALRPAIQTCMNAGVKVVTVDTALTNTAGLVSAITSNNIQGGEAAAGVIAKALKGRGQVAVFSIDGTTTTQVERVQGLKKGLARYPGISIVSAQFTGQPETVSETDTKAIMTSHPQVKALFGAAETNAEGAAQALSSLGATGKLTVVGYDADPSAVSLLKTGAISALVIQQPAREGQLGVEYGNDALTGHTSLVKTSVLLPNILVTTAEAGNPSNARYYYPAAS
jgi:ribose transport system substrate-binding protein